MWTDVSGEKTKNTNNKPDSKMKQVTAVNRLGFLESPLRLLILVKVTIAHSGLEIHRTTRKRETRNFEVDEVQTCSQTIWPTVVKIFTSELHKTLKNERSTIITRTCSI